MQFQIPNPGSKFPAIWNKIGIYTYPFADNTEFCNSQTEPNAETTGTSTHTPHHCRSRPCPARESSDPLIRRDTGQRIRRNDKKRLNRTGNRVTAPTNIIPALERRAGIKYRRRLRVVKRAAIADLPLRTFISSSTLRTSPPRIRQSRNPVLRYRRPHRRLRRFFRPRTADTRPPRA